MALGAVYIRPQAMALPAGDEVSPADVILAFFEAILKDPQAALPAFKIMGEEASAAVRDFVAGMEEKLRFADGKLRNVFAPFVAPVMAFATGLSGDVTAALPAFLTSISQLLDQFTADGMAGLVSELFAVFENDLGISPATLHDLFTDLMTRMIEKLQAPVTSGDTSDAAVALYDYGVALDDIRLLVLEDLPFPQFTGQIVQDLVRRLWQDLPVDRVVWLIREILKRGEQVLDPLAKIATAIAEVTISVNVAPSNRIMAASVPPGMLGNLKYPTGKPDAPTAWYASWAAGTEVRYWGANDLRNVGVTVSTDPSDPTYTRFDNPYLAGFTYSNTLTQDTMESIAHHTAWIFTLVDALFHVVSMEQADFVDNLMTVLFDTLEIVTITHGIRKDEKDTTFVTRPFPWWVKAYIWPGTEFIGRLLETIERIGGTGHFSDDPYPWLSTLLDMLEGLLYKRWTWLMRELLMSCLTLANHDSAQLAALRQKTTDPTALALINQNTNANYFDGICLSAGELGTLFFCLICAKTRRADYGLNAKNMGLTGPHIGLAIANALGIFPVFNLLAFLLIRLFTKEPLTGADFKHFGRMVLRERMFRPYSFNDAGDGIATVLAILMGVVMAFMDYMIYLHFFSDAATDNGTLAIDTNGTSAGQSLAGYPDPTQSPYLLPWADSQQTCVQGNMGIFSHYPQGGSGLTYAFDFALDEGVEVLCSRDGIIVDIDDTIQTGTHNNWNHVLVMHVIVVRPEDPVPAGLPAAALQAAIPPPPGVTAFADGTALPLKILIPPFWDSKGNSLVGFSPPLHPSACILPSTGWAPKPYYAGFGGFPANTKFALLLPGQDNVGFGADNKTPPNFGTVLNGGTVPAAGNPLLPITATFMTYGHGKQNFMTTAVPAKGGSKPLYRSGTPGSSGTQDSKGADLRGQVLGQFVQRGQIIMLADNTGISMMNHVHVHVNGQIQSSPTGIGSGQGAEWSIPFVYQDLTHDIRNGIYKGIAYGSGRGRFFTAYSSGNTRRDPE